MIGDTYKLKNGFWIYSKGILFDLGLNDDLIIADCSNFSYVADKLIITKKKNVITIFSTVTIEKNGKKEPKVLATFSNSCSNIFANVIIDNTCYIIDYNCQVTTHPIRHKLYPKIN